jgi:DNA-binding CsgD family transcriptional regulator
MHQSMGLGDELRGVFRTGETTWGMVALWRDAGQTPFSPAEEKLLSDLSAPIGEAFRRSALLRLATDQTTPEGPGLLVFDRDGALLSYNQQAQAWLDELPQTPGEPAAGGVPISTGVRAVLGLAQATAAGVESGAARVRIQSRRGRWLLVHAFPMCGQPGVQGSIAVIIEPAKASEIAPIILRAYELSPREQEISCLLGHGLTTTEIAQRLYLSPHTVRDYIKSIFDKVGVSSRGELVARIFADHYAEPLRHAHSPN